MDPVKSVKIPQTKNLVQDPAGIRVACASLIPITIRNGTGVHFRIWASFREEDVRDESNFFDPRGFTRPTLRVALSRARRALSFFSYLGSEHRILQFYAFSRLYFPI